MTPLRQSLERPRGQVLLATLFFCFIFAVLFGGLYRAGLVYGLKERSVRACDLTALSAGAVYANGLQLVRVTNLLLLAFAMLDLTVIAAEVAAASALSLGALDELALKADPHFRKVVQDLQSALFGINLPVPGLYPALIFVEGISLAGRNDLEDNWPLAGGFSFKPAFPPSPLFLFNFETASPLYLSVVPDMALKFRTADQFLTQPDSEDPKTYYRYQDSKTGDYHYVEEKDTEVAPGSANSGQRRVKKGLDGSGKWLQLTPVTLGRLGEEAEGKAEADLKRSGLSRVTSSFRFLAPLLKGIPMDVTDRDDPPNHTFVVYGSLPTRLKDPRGAAVKPSALSEVSVEGPGLAAWDLPKPRYQTRRVDLGPGRLAHLLASEGGLQGLIQNGRVPEVTDLFGSIPLPAGP